MPLFCIVSDREAAIDHRVYPAAGGRSMVWQTMENEKNTRFGHPYQLTSFIKDLHKT